MNWPWRPPQATPWPTPFAVPKDTAEALAAQGGCDNFGLMMERYLAFSDNRGQVQLLREMTDRKGLVPDFSRLGEVIAGQLARWEQVAEDLGAVTFTARPEWRVLVGKATNVILDGGMTLHPVLGVPVMPSSSLKGVCRVWARWALERPEEEMGRLFGVVDDVNQQRGDLVFLDGVPVVPPVIEREVLNPLAGAYYRDENTPPASYLSGQPIFFLTVGGRSVYRFGVASGSGDEEAAGLGAQWLKEALQHHGVGAKSAAGYGFWVMEEGQGGGAAPG